MKKFLILGGLIFLMAVSNVYAMKREWSPYVTGRLPVQAWENSAIYKAICKGYKEVVELLLSNDVDFSMCDESGNTLLHFAIRKADESAEHTSIANMLIKAYKLANKNIDQVNNKGNSPLHLAAEHGCAGMVASLIRTHADVKRTNIDGITPLHLACTRNGNVSVVEQLVRAGADVNAYDKVGCTPLFYAIAAEKTDIVRFLLSNGADVKNAKAQHAMLYVACALGNKEIAEMLISSGAVVTEDLITMLKEMQILQ